MVFNPDPNKPAEEVIFTNRNSTSYDTLSFPGVDVKTADFHKHLGFVLDSQMNNIKHVDGKIAKENQGIGVIKRLFNYMQRKALLQIYKSFIRPHLDYCDAIYHKPTYDDYCDVIYHKPTYDDYYSRHYSDRAKSDPVYINYEFTNKITL